MMIRVPWVYFIEEGEVMYPRHGLFICREAKFATLVLSVRGVRHRIMHCWQRQKNLPHRRLWYVVVDFYLNDRNRLRIFVRTGRDWQAEE